MRPRLQAHLTPEEDQTLFEVRTATHLPQRVRDRAEVIRLSHQGWFVEKIADFFNCRIQTVRDTLHRWDQGGLGGLWDGWSYLTLLWQNSRNGNAKNIQRLACFENLWAINATPCWPLLGSWIKSLLRLPFASRCRYRRFAMSACSTENSIPPMPIGSDGISFTVNFADSFTC